MKKQFKVLMINKESLLGSILSDTYSFLLLGLAFWFNYRFIGGSYMVNALILTFLIIGIARTFSSKDKFFFRKVSEDQIQKIIELVDNE